MAGFISIGDRLGSRIYGLAMYQITYMYLLMSATT